MIIADLNLRLSEVIRFWNRIPQDAHPLISGNLIQINTLFENELLIFQVHYVNKHNIKRLKS